LVGAGSRRAEVKIPATLAEIEICFQPKEELNLSARGANVNWKMGWLLMFTGFWEIIVLKRENFSGMFPLTRGRMSGRLRNGSDRTMCFRVNGGASHCTPKIWVAGFLSGKRAL